MFYWKLLVTFQTPILQKIYEWLFLITLSRADYDLKFTLVRTKEHTLGTGFKMNVFWTSYVRSIYVLCTRVKNFLLFNIFLTHWKSMREDILFAGPKFDIVAAFQFPAPG